MILDWDDMDKSALEFQKALKALYQCDHCGLHASHITTFRDAENELSVCDDCIEYAAGIARGEGM